MPMISTIKWIDLHSNLKLDLPIDYKSYVTVWIVKSYHLIIVMKVISICCSNTSSITLHSNHSSYLILVFLMRLFG